MHKEKGLVKPFDRKLPLVRLLSDLPAVLDLDVTTHGTPKITKPLGELVSHGAFRIGAFGREEIAEGDVKNFLCLAEGTLVVDQYQRLPAKVVAHAKHTQRKLKIIEAAIKICDSFTLDSDEFRFALQGSFWHVAKVVLLFRVVVHGFLLQRKMYL